MIDYGDFRVRLAPIAAVMRQHRKQVLGMSAVEFSRAAGPYDQYVSVLESGLGLRNPTIGKLVHWAKMAQAQEFGLYVVLNGVTTDVSLIDERGE